MTVYRTTNSIKTWSEEDRPREKMLLKGKAALSKAELIAILLGSGTHEMSAVDVAKGMLRKVNDSLLELAKLSIHDLMQIKGIGQARAISIVAALELGRRRRYEDALEKEKINSSHDAFEYMQLMAPEAPYEAFWILLLSRANRILKAAQISEGGMTGTVADPKRIFKEALDNRATHLILCHNHPPEPEAQRAGYSSYTKTCESRAAA